VYVPSLTCSAIQSKCDSVLIKFTPSNNFEDTNQMDMREIKRTLKAMTPKQLVELDSWLHNLITTKTAVSQHKSGKREVMKQYPEARRTYRLERVRCGKESCKCAKGALHGPYWYAYWSEGGKSKSEYVGKHLPETQAK